ncbi:MAG: radical SAM protein [Planctomycetota bacterium]|nr:radical SAM protein [Planctomycetota bacterium]
MDTHRKLELLADDSRYDLSCACGSTDGDHRRRGPGGTWLYPASLPGGGTSIMLKTLLSNSCVNDCRYCPLRNDQDRRRCALEPEEVAGVFMDYARGEKAFGLFLTSAVIRSPDYTMDRMTATGEILRRKFGYRGYLHLKIIPGASDAAIAKALSLASAVSLNVEAPKRSAFAALSEKKDFDRDIVRPMKLISQLTARGNRYERVKQTTQFIVGASDETDSDIVRATFGLYRRLRLNRVYFSAYQRGLGDPSLPGERNRPARPEDILTREHRLYQADFLIRKYKWDLDDILFEDDDNLSLDIDPKQRWVERHPEFFPVRILSAGREELLRVPGIGPITAGRIIKTRRQGRITGLEDVGLRGKRLQKTLRYAVME